MRSRVVQWIGLAGAFGCLAVFAYQPSFPTPDKLLVFLTLLFIGFKRGKALLLRLAPFVGLLLIYETFRGLVPHINHRVEYGWMPAVDRALFGELPTATLQQWLWSGQTQWYDIALYLFYMAHFVLPVALALLVWKYREKFYGRYIISFVVLTLAGFLTFLLFPAAPPWLAAQEGVIEPVRRVSSDVWFSLGVNDFPSLYNSLSPNPVAAVPSLHAAYATLFSIFIFRFFGRRWGMLSVAYPLAIYFGTVYQGEHYVIDELIGAAYGVGAYAVSGVKAFASPPLRLPAAIKNLWLKSPRPYPNTAANTPE